MNTTSSAGISPGPEAEEVVDPHAHNWLDPYLAETSASPQNGSHDPKYARPASDPSDDELDQEWVEQLRLDYPDLKPLPPKDDPEYRAVLKDYITKSYRLTAKYIADGIVTITDGNEQDRQWVLAQLGKVGKGKRDFEKALAQFRTVNKLQDLTPDQRKASEAAWLDARHHDAIAFDEPCPVPECTRPGHVSGDINADLGMAYLDAIPPDPPPPLLIDRLDPEGHTILFGPGGSGKGTLASSWITQLQGLGLRTLIVDYEDHPGEWSRRTQGLGADRSKIAIIRPSTASWDGTRGPLWQQIEDIKRCADQAEADFIVIDSIVAACVGFNPAESDTAGLYGTALSYLGRPALSIAHVNRAKDLTQPFGSAFWHNFARMTWSLDPKPEDGYAILKSRKANNYGPQPTQKVEVVWSDGRPIQVIEQRYAEHVRDLVQDALTPTSDEPTQMTLEEITSLVNELTEDKKQKATIQRTLNRGTSSTRTTPAWVRKVGDKYELVTSEMVA